MRLIDADELIERTWRWAVNSREAVQQMIKGCPTIDAVPVIRCKDCKYWYGSGNYCDYEMRAFEDDFCSMGERRNLK